MTTKSGIPVFFLFPFINELEYTIDLKLNKNLISIIHIFITSHLSFGKLDFHLNGFMSKWEFTVAVGAHLRSSLTLLSLQPGQRGQAAAVATANPGHGFSSKKGTTTIWAEEGGKHSADSRVGRLLRVPLGTRLLGWLPPPVCWGVFFVPRLSSVGSPANLLLPRFPKGTIGTVGTIDIAFPSLGSFEILRQGDGLRLRLWGNSFEEFFFLLHDSLAALKM